MFGNDNKAFVRRYLSALSGRDKPPSIVAEYVSNVDEALKRHIAAFEFAFPRYEMAAEDVLADGDKVAIRAIFRGVHRGDLQGIPPTGKLVTLPLLIIYRIASGKIVEHWMAYDQLSFLQQLGVAPAPVQPSR